MTAKKPKKETTSPSGRSHLPPEVPPPLGSSTNPTRGRPEHDGVDHGLDERAKARKNAKPRSARETLKGPNDRKASTARKTEKRAPR